MNNNSQEENRDFSDLYAVVNKKKSNKCKNQEENKNSFALYAVVDKKKNTTECKDLEKTSNSSDLYAVIDNSKKKAKIQNAKQNTVSEKLTSKIDETKPDCDKIDITVPFKAKTTLINIIWAISFIILIVFIVVLVITTAIGFIKASRQQSQSSHTLMDSSTTVGFTPNDISTISSAPTSSVEVMNSSTPTINTLHSHPNYSHLQNLFDSNEILKQLVRNCNSRGKRTLFQCVNSALNIYGMNVLIPAKSCKELHKTVTNNSGYYWVTASDGSTVQVYCDMIATCGNMTGGLTRIANLNLSTKSQYCTGNISFDNNGCFKTSPLPGCSGFVFTPLNLNLSYLNLCGTVEGRYFGYPEGFAGDGRPSNTAINDNYVDGISLTYGNTSQRRHIWTFSACRVGCTARTPEFVEKHHSTLSLDSAQSAIMFQRNYLPLLSEDIEVRLCQDENRDTKPNEGLYLGSMNIYVN